jgi:hypothetical protein
MTGREIVSYDKEWAEQADRYAAQEKIRSGTFLSMRGGVLSFGDEELPGNQACVIILDAVKENTYYDHKFDPNQAASPICYAFGRGDEPMAPHHTMQADLSYFQPQASECSVCPKNEWGSADKGRGKACQNRRRLALIPAGYYQPKRGTRDMDLELFDDEKHFKTADIAYLKLSVGSVKEWGKYVNQIAASIHRPPHGVITRLYVEPDPKFQFVAKFEMIEQVPDTLAQVIMGRHEEAVKTVMQGYMVPEKHEGAPQGSLRGLRRR